MYVIILICVGIYLSMDVCWYMCILVYMYVRGCTRMCQCARVGIKCIFIFICMFACVLQRLGFVLWDPNPATGDPDPIRIHARCGPDTMVFRRPIHRMIHKSVPVRTVKTRWRFGFETASFHVSVRSYVFTVVGMLYMLPLSFCVTFRYILLVWLLVPLHETSMSVHFIHVVDIYLY